LSNKLFMRIKHLLFAEGAFALALFAVQPVFAQKKAIGPAVSIVANERGDGTPASVSFGTSGAYKAADAAKVFQQYLALNPGTDELRFKAVDKASADISIARYTQFYKGIKVEHGSYIIASKNDVMSYMSGNFYRTSASINTQPQLTESVALQKALDHTGAKKYIWEIPGADAQLQRDLNKPGATYAPKGELVLIEDYFGGEVPDGKLHLAWHFDIYAVEPLSRNDVYVDAVTGRILFTNAIMKHVQATGNSVYSGPVAFQAMEINGGYSLNDTTRGGGVNTYTLSDSTAVSDRDTVRSTTTAFASGVAIDAHWGAGKVYDYWKTVHNRLSYDNQNSPLNSYVNYGRGYNNAFWSGSAMFYGNGTGRAGGGFDPLVSLDICSHEIGHGVCQQTAGLIYSRESGGINEGFSDIWGAVIEHYANPNETDARAKSRWEIGEEIGNAPLRNMANPGLYGDPDTYGGNNWKFATSNCSPNGNGNSPNYNDNCGVHSNSGVLNKWFYLLTEGGTGINTVNKYYAVAGIGIDTAALIAYGTELSLTPTANYALARTNSINYATAQFGAYSKVVEAVIRAWHAVNVGNNYTACTPQVSFEAPVTNVIEDAAMSECLGSRTVSVPVVLNGPAPTGGNAVVTIAVTGGTAVSGQDYTIPSATLIFPAGSTAPQMLSIMVFDNGNSVDTNKYIDLTFTLAANGSDVTSASVLTTTRVKITNDDLAPWNALNNTRTIGTGGSTANATSPFLSTATQARVQYILTADELRAAGIRRNAALTKIGFSIITKASTQPFSNFNIELGHTTANIFTPTSGFITAGLQPVFNGSVTTTAGTNTITFDSSFVWDGVSNLVVAVCFTNTTRINANDQVQGFAASGNRTAYASSSGIGGGCSLPFAPASIGTTRPVIRLTQEAPSVVIESSAASTRKWEVRTNDRTYFYSDNDKELIAGIWNGTSDLGCVEATVTQEGIGFAKTSFSGVNRSIKEYLISVSENDTASYTGIFYLTTAELNGANTNNLQIVKTTAATDAEVDASNMETIPIAFVTNGTGYRAFRTTFRGFGRYFFVDATPNLAIGMLTANTGSMAVINNPFSHELKVGYNVARGETAIIKLLDITGKVVYSNSQALQRGQGRFGLPVGNLSLAPGSYILQVMHTGGVFTAQVVKQ
jgi:Zn-dependent metalloprotease